MSIEISIEISTGFLNYPDGASLAEGRPRKRNYYKSFTKDYVNIFIWNLLWDFIGFRFYDFDVPLHVYASWRLLIFEREVLKHFVWHALGLKGPAN